MRAHRGRPLGAARGALHARLRGLGGVRCTASAVSELARVEWHRVGGVCRRVYAELEAARGASRFDGVHRIGISNGRVEAINNKIKVTARMGYGFRNTDNLVALLMPRCGDCQPQLPRSPAKAGKKGAKGAKSVAA